MTYVFSVEEAAQRLFVSLSESTGWRYVKSKNCLKKTVRDLLFEIDFFFSKWNISHENVEVNAEFRLCCKSYGKSPEDSVIASLSYRPDLYVPYYSCWYDISTEEKLLSSFEDLNGRIQNTAVSLCRQFEDDYPAAAESLLKEHFDEYNVHLDFIADKLGMSAIREKVREIYDGLSDEMKKQIADYKNGARNALWMNGRTNLKFIVDNDLVKYD